MARGKQADSRAAQILRWLETNPRKTTAQIAQAVGWTTKRVSAAIWAELHRSPSEIVREERQDPGRTTPTYVYSHKDTHTHPRITPISSVEQPKVQPSVRVTFGDLTDRVVCDELVDSELVSCLSDRPGPVAPPTERGLDSFVEELARAIATQVLSRVEEQLAVQLKHILPATTQPLKPISIEALTRQIMPVKQQGSPRPTVLIAGLLPNQAGIIQQEFGEVFDLRFYMVEENLSRLHAMLPGADYVFTFTSKISHKVEEVMKSAGKTIRRCSGGMTMLKEQLLNLYVNTEGKPYE